MTSERSRNGPNKSCLGCVAALVIGLAVLFTGAFIVSQAEFWWFGILAPPKMPAPPHAQPVVTPPAVVSPPVIVKMLPEPPPKRINWFSPSRLVSIYESNEVQADEFFTHGGVAVKGRVERVGKNFEGGPYVIVTDSNLEGIRRVQAFFDYEDELMSVWRGETVTVYGRCEGLSVNVTLTHCRLLPKEEIGKPER
jgi:hypothetical protein